MDPASGFTPTSTTGEADANQRPSFTTTSDVINFQRLSAGVAAAASSSPSKAGKEGVSQRLSLNPFDEEDEGNFGEEVD